MLGRRGRGAVGSGRGIGRTKKNPMIIGKDVPRESRRRNSDVSPGYAMCAIEENRNAESPNPESTSPVADARIWSGKVLAVALTLLVRPPFPPAPVKNEQTTKMENEKLDNRSTSPESGLS